MAGLVKPDDAVGADRLRFVTEAEASAYFTLHYSTQQANDWLLVGLQFAVLDLGGSTVDITVYTVEKLAPKLTLRETKIPACVQAGGIFPTQVARHLLRAKLRQSNYIDDLETMVAQFNVKTKCIFSAPTTTSIIKFGHERDNDLAVGIARGRLTLTGDDVQKTFKLCLDRITEALNNQLVGSTVKRILMVGGFSESSYLQTQLREKYGRRGIQIVHTNEPTSKAVAEGASFFHLDASVMARVIRLFDYGIHAWRPWSEVSSIAAPRPTFLGPLGEKRVLGVWGKWHKKEAL